MELKFESEMSLSWRVRFKTASGIDAFTVITKEGGFPLAREEVQEWAEAQVRLNPYYLAVTAIVNRSKTIKPS